MKLTEHLSNSTWSTCLLLLESAASTSSRPPSLSSFLTSNLAALQHPYSPFPSSPASKTSLTSGSLVLVPKGAKVDVSKDEQTAALDVASRFQVDEVVAFKALQVARKGAAEKGRQGEEGKLSEDEWDRVTAWMFEERMAVIGVVGLLLRTRESPHSFRVSEEVPHPFPLQTTTLRIRSTSFPPPSFPPFSRLPSPHPFSPPSLPAPPSHSPRAFALPPPTPPSGRNSSSGNKKHYSNSSSSPSTLPSPRPAPTSSLFSKQFMRPSLAVAKRTLGSSTWRRRRRSRRLGSSLPSSLSRQ